jgi:hypothetical protein
MRRVQIIRHWELNRLTVVQLGTEIVASSGNGCSLAAQTRALNRFLDLVQGEGMLFDAKRAQRSFLSPRQRPRRSPKGGLSGKVGVVDPRGEPECIVTDKKSPGAMVRAGASVPARYVRQQSIGYSKEVKLLLRAPRYDFFRRAINRNIRSLRERRRIDDFFATSAGRTGRSRRRSPRLCDISRRTCLLIRRSSSPSSLPQTKK